MRPGPASLDLRIVPVPQLRLHEDFDPWRAKRLVINLSHQGVLKNPLIVTELADTFIVLDGATRATALAEMGVAHALVQVVRYGDPSVTLQTWNHVLVGIPSSSLLQELGRIPNLRSLSADLPEVQAALNARRAVVGVVTEENCAITYASGESCHEQIRQLTQVVAAYRGRAEVHRAAELDLSDLLSAHPDLTAVVVFPPFTPDDVRRCSSNEVKLPMGITRHVIRGRALGINVPLDLLAGEDSLEQKNAWLQENVQSRLRQNKVRLYEEPTLVFDE